MYKLSWSGSGHLSRVLLAVTAGLIVGGATITYAAITSGAFTVASSTRVRITQVAVAKPATTVGDLMIAAIAVNGGTSASVTAPSGWTLLQSADNDTNISLLTYYKFVTNVEPPSYAWSISDQTNAQGSITTYAGVNPTSPFDAATSSVGFASSATAPSVRTLHANDRVIAFYATDVGKSALVGTYFSTPTGMTEKFDSTNAPYGPSLAAEEATQASAGLTPSWVSVISGKKARNWATQTIALNVSRPSIAYDNSAEIYFDDPVTLNYTVGNGTNRALVACEYTTLDNSLPPTYDGVPLTFVGKSFYHNVGNQGIAVYMMANPPSGTHVFQENTTGNVHFSYIASYSGVAQVIPPDAFSTNQADGQQTITDSVNVSAADDWLVMCTSDSGTGSIPPQSYSSTGTIRLQDIRLAGVLTDSNGGLLQGNNSMSVSMLGSINPTFSNDVLIALKAAQ